MKFVMRQSATRKAILESHGIHPESYRLFIRDLKKNFEKKKDRFHQTRIQEITGQNAETIKKYLTVAVELRDLRRYYTYYHGCPRLEIIDLEDTLTCPSCNNEVLPPTEGNEVVCECGIHYIKQNTGKKWIYKPQIEYLRNASWKIESFTYPGEEFYEVRPFDGYCSCPHHTIHGVYCKHLQQVTDLVANIVLDKVICNDKSKASSSLIVIATALTRLFDSRKTLKQLTYRMLGNAMEKSGLTLSKAILARIVSELAKKDVLSRTSLPLSCIEGMTLISLNQWVLKQFLQLDKSIIDSYTQNFKVHVPEHKTSFLKLDNVVYSDVMRPNSEYALSVELNYCFSKPTPVRLELRDAQSHIILRSATITLNGEDVTSIPLKLNSPKIQTWIPEVELYFQDDKKEWHLVDHYLAGRRIFAPVIKMNKTIPGLYEVESFSQPDKFYEVDSIGKRCTCPAYIYHQSCKHLEMIENIGFLNNI